MAVALVQEGIFIFLCLLLDCEILSLDPLHFGIFVQQARSTEDTEDLFLV